MVTQIMMFPVRYERVADRIETLMAIMSLQEGADLFDLREYLDAVDEELSDQSWKQWQVHYIDWDNDPRIQLVKGVREISLGEGWTIKHQEIHRDAPGRLRYLLEEGVDRDPGYGEVTILQRDASDGTPIVWMADTRAEILGHLPAINAINHLCDTQAEVRVLITGFGLGMIVGAALARPEVKRVDVIEIDPTVIKAMSQIWTDPRLHIIEADALEYTPAGHWDYIWHDIWPEISADNVEQMKTLRAKYGNVQQNCWEEERCLEMLETSSEDYWYIPYPAPTEWEPE